jgi:WD40 repeat protein
LEEAVAILLPDNAILFADQDKQTIKVRDPHLPQADRNLFKYESTILHLAASIDGKIIASTHFPGAGLVWIWDAETGQHLRNIGDVPSPVGSFALGNDKVAMRGGYAHWITVLDIKTGEEIYKLLGDSTCHLSFSPDESRLAARWLTSVELWDMQTGKSLHDLPVIGLTTAGPVFTPDNSILATASWRHHEEPHAGFVWVWDAASGHVRHKLEGYTNRVHSIAFSPDGALLATGMGQLSTRIVDVSQPAIWLWDVKTGTRLYVVQRYNASISHLMFSPDGTLLLSTSTDGTARLWGIPPGD